MKKIYIYLLIDPISNKIRYVGQSVNPKDRYKGHLSTSKKRKTDTQIWIANLLDKCSKPLLKVLTFVEGQERADALEIELITHYKSFCDLTNEGTGGEGLTEPTLEKMRRSILQYDLQGNFIKEWKAINKTAEILNLDKTALWTALNYKNRTCGKSIWKYKVGNDIPFKIEVKKKRILKEFINPESEAKIIGSAMYGDMNPMRKKAKKVDQYDLNDNFVRSWQSAKHAGRELNINASCIRRCCQGQYKQMKGTKWKYNEEKEVSNVL